MLLTADKYGRTDGSAYQMVQQINSPIPIVLVARAEDYEFNEELLKLDKWICIDFYEYCWNWDRKTTHIWGWNTRLFEDRLTSGEWNRFDEWVTKNPPILTFKRELLKRDANDTLQPIEYPCIVPKHELQSREQFNKRPINALWYWGRSHEERVRLHADIWRNSFTRGAAVCDNVYYVANFLQEESNPDKWVTLNIPHYSRIDIQNILSINELSKVGISLAGSGLKCFRHAEAPSNAIMAMEMNDFAWTFPWDETNSIQFKIEKEIETIYEALQKDNLYDIYLKGVANCNKYRLENYIHHLEKRIKECLTVS